MPMRFEFDYKKIFSTDLILGVGTTTEQYKRGSLPEPLPDNTNSIWLATNGSDANPGTQASPKLTLNGSIAALAGAIATVHIFRNGASGDLEFLETLGSTLGVGFNIQVEGGEIGIIKYDSGSGRVNQERLRLLGDNKINGIKFNETDTYKFGGTHSIIRIDGITHDYNIENCEFEVANNIITEGLFSSNFCIYQTWIGNSGVVNIDRCVFKSASCILAPTNTDINITGCILFFNGIGVLRNPLSSAGIFIVSIGFGTSKTIAIKNTYFIGWTTGNSVLPTTKYASPCIYYSQETDESNVGSHTMNIDGSAFYGTNSVIVVREIGSSTLTAVININYCFTGGNTLIQSVEGGLTPVSYTVINSNEIDSGTPAMFVNENVALTGDTDLFRLQFEGKQTPDGSSRFFLDSPFVGAGRVPEGSLIYAIKDTPWGSYTALRDVDEAPDMTLFIVDLADRIFRINLDGSVITTIATNSLVGGVSSPESVTYDHSDDTIWFSDTTPLRIYNTQVDGSSIISSFLYTAFEAGATLIQGMGYEKATDTLWLAGAVSKKVYNVTKAGALISSFLWSVFDITQIVVQGIAVAEDGTLWMVGSSPDKVYHTERDGTLITSYNSTVYQPSSTSPSGIGMSKNGYAWISEGGVDRVNYVNVEGTTDLSPFTEITELVSEGFNQLLDIDWAPTSYQREDQLINAVSEKDVNGNLKTDYDTIRIKYTFTYGSDIHISNVLLKEILNLLSTKGSKKFLPLGDAGNLYDLAPTSAGTFSNIDNSVSPTAAISTNMVPNNWRGYWITIASDDYYIASNDTLKLYLEDRHGNGFPVNGAVTFIVSYILVNNPAESMVRTQQFFTNFLKGGGIREDSTEVRAYDLTIDGFTFEEIEDLEESE